MEQNVLLTKMIGIVVAVIVAAVVLVPICNSLTEGDGGSNGGSGGGSGSGEVIFTMGDFYSQYFDGWEYESYKTYSPYVEGTHPFDIDSEDMRNIVNSFRAMNVEGGLSFFNIMGISAGSFTVYAGLQYNVAQGGGDEYVISLYVTTETDSFGLAIIDDESNNAQYSSTFSFRCGSSQATFEYQYYDGGSTVSDSISIPLSSIQLEFLLSKNQAGFLPDTLSYDGSESSLMGSVIFNDQKVLLDCSIESTGERYEEIIPVSIENFNEAVESGNVTFTGTKDSREYSVDSEVMNYPDEGWYVLDNIHAAVNVSPPYDESTKVYYNGLYLSNYTGDGGGDSGGDGGSSDTGVTGTLIKTIPIFVILGIILGSVALFYQNRNGL